MRATAARGAEAGSQMGSLPLSCPHCRHHMQAGQESCEGGSRSLVSATRGVTVASFHYTLSHTEGRRGPGACPCDSPEAERRLGQRDPRL